MQNIRAILFDLGNTLIYFDGEWSTVLSDARRAALAALHQAGLQVAIEPFMNIFRETMENHYARREDDLLERTTHELLAEALCALGYCSVPSAVLDTARHAFYTITQAHWLPEQEALPTVQTLSQHYSIGIISNAADDEDVQTLVDKAQLRPYLDFVLTSAAFGQRKPAPDIFRDALAHWHLPPEQVAMVGDTLNADILGANRTGLFSIWLTRRVKTPLVLLPEGEMRPALTVSSLHHLTTEFQKTWRLS